VETEAFADGGTICVRIALSSDVDWRVCLGPKRHFCDSLTGRLSVSEHIRSQRTQRNYDIVARSDLERQVVELLNRARCLDDQCSRYRDNIVTFVESDRYVELYREVEVRRSAMPDGDRDGTEDSTG